MAYTDTEAVLTYINNVDLIPFTQDDPSGTADAARIAAIIATVSTKIDGYLANRYAVPFNPVPAFIANAATMFACEAFWQRRLTPADKNPFKDECDEIRKMLKEIHDGTGEIDANLTQLTTPVQYTSRCLAFNDTTM